MVPVLLSRRTWEPGVTWVLKALRGNIFIDVGANIGFYSTLLCDNFQQIIAVEPDPILYAYLCRYKPHNCSAIQMAISDSIGMVRFYRSLDTSNFGSGSLLHPRETKEWAQTAPKQEIEVRQTTLPNVIPTNFDVVDLVKVDVEGAEWHVLRGAEAVMYKIRNWVIEIHDHTRKGELSAYMEARGYQCKWLDTGHGLFQRGSPDPWQRKQHPAT
jgi:FkbM family methyltransferase